MISLCSSVSYSRLLMALMRLAPSLLILANTILVGNFTVGRRVLLELDPSDLLPDAILGLAESVLAS